MIAPVRISPFLSYFLLGVALFPGVSAAENFLSTRVEGGGGDGNSYGEFFEISEINRTKDSATETSLTDNESVTYGPHGGVGATARYGRLSARVSSFSTYTIGSLPYLFSDFIGTSIVAFEDELTIQGNGAALPDFLEVRTTWSLEGDLAYTVPDPGSISENGTLWGGIVSYSCDLGVGNAVVGSIQRARFDASPVPGGEGLPQTIMQVEGATPNAPFILRAILSAEAAAGYDYSSSQSFGIELSSGVSTGSSTVNLKLVGMEIIDSNTGDLLSARVTSSSGHVYPVVQPPKLNGEGEVTAFTVNRETTDVFLSFASEEGEDYCVQGGDALGSWEDLTTMTGSPRVSFVNLVDPPSEISPSRFYRVIPVAE